VDVGICPHKVLVASLTLGITARGADYAHHILMSPPSFESHRGAWVPGSLQNFDFQSQFAMSKIIRVLLKIIFIEEYNFRSTHFIIDIF
jgi:hypothetical protein